MAPESELLRLEPLPGLGSVVGRRPRVLALHGGASNAHVLRFQTAQLRRALGDAEWLFPEGLEPGHPHADVPESLIRSHGGASSGRERTELEKRISKGRPFVCWWKFEVSQDTRGWRFQEASYRRGTAALMDYVLQEGPVDVVVTFSQGGLMLAALTHCFVEAGKQVPWRLNLVFHAPDIVPEALPCAGVRLVQPTLFITSRADELYDVQLDSWTRHCTHVGFLSHDDGFGFPATAPLAPQIYAHLAGELRRHCGVGSLEGSLGAADQARRQTCSPEDAAEPRAPPISAEDFAALLRSGGCLVADARELPTPFPGAELGIGARALRTKSRAALRRLAELREDGRPLVVVSEDGGPEFCGLLLELLGERGLGPPALRLLAGGIGAWRAWELRHGTAAAELRELRPARGPGGPSAVAPPELARLLLADGCLVADAREADESRGDAFPGALKGAGLLTLRRRPAEARRRLRGLLEAECAVVAVSVTGARCREYCDRLVRDLGLEAGRVRWLEGGIRGWNEWAAHNEDLAEQVRRTCGLLPARGRRAALSDDGGAEARDHSLEVLGAAMT